MSVLSEVRAAIEMFCQEVLVLWSSSEAAESRQDSQGRRFGVYLFQITRPEVATIHSARTKDSILH